MELDFSKLTPADVTTCQPIKNGKVYEMYCIKCAKVLMQNITDSLFASKMNRCSCGWKCCKAAYPPHQMHEAHHAYREQK